MERIKTLFRKKSARLIAMMCLVALIIGLVPTVMFMRSSSAAAWDGSTQTQPSGSGTKDDPYLIANGANLAWMAGQTRAHNSLSGKYFKQTADIDLGGKIWAPIGGGIEAGNTYFCGTYVGCGYSISNFKFKDVTSYSNYYPAIFESISETATVRNVHVASGNINISSYNVSSIVGELWGGTIVGCSNNASIRNSSGKDFSFVGGISIKGNYDKMGNIIGCYNTGSLSAVNATYCKAYAITDPSFATVTGCYSTSGSEPGTIVSTDVMKNTDGQNTVINGMNSALRDYYNNNNVTDRYYYTYDGSKNGYPVQAYKMKPTANDLTVSAVPTSKVYDGQPVTAVTATTKSTGMGTLSEVKYGGSTTVPSEPGTYSVTVDITEGVDYRAGTITLGSFTISKGTLTVDNLDKSDVSGANKVYDGEPVVITATLKSGLSGAENLSAVKYNGETTPPTDVGTYKATVEMKGSSAWNDGTVELGTFEITKATVSASDIDPGKINDFLYSMELSSNTPAANKYGYYSWENATSLATTRGPGEHTLIFTPKDIKNYDWSALDGKDGWTLNADSQTLSKTFTVNTVYVPERQIVVYFNKNAMK